jgi:hypothetical protein
MRDYGSCIRRLLDLEIWMRIVLNGEPAKAVAVSAEHMHAIQVN